MKHTYKIDEKGIRHTQSCPCGETENLMKKQYNKANRIQYYMCRKCNTKNLRNYRKTEQGMKNVRKAVYRSIKKHKDKQNARVLLRYHVKAGHIIKPKTCEDCGKEKKLDAHHEDYEKPLEVNWLCRVCHFKIHERCLNTVERV